MSNWWEKYPLASPEDARTAGKAIGKGPAPISATQEKELQELRGLAQAGRDLSRTYEDSLGAITRLGTGPVKASLLDMVLPQESGGFFDKLGGIIGTVPRALGLPSQRTVDDFQDLKGLSSGLVLDKQIEQKGPQTEADAARLQLSQISPYKSTEANFRVFDRGYAKAQLASRKSDFYMRWAAEQGGLNALDRQGRSVEDAWNQFSKSFERNFASRRSARKSPQKANSFGMVPGSEEDGYRYLGGDPANPKSWRKLR